MGPNRNKSHITWQFLATGLLSLSIQQCSEGGLQGHWWRLLDLSLVQMLGLGVEVAAREQWVTLHLVR